MLVMSGKIRALANISIGLIVFIVTLVVFFLGYSNHPKEIIDWLGLTFVLISEIIFFGSMTVILIRKYTSSQMLLLSGVISALFIYWIGTTLLSIFSNNIFHDNVRGFVTTQFIILAIALIISIALYSAVVNIKAHDSKVITSKLTMNECENLVFSLKSNTNFDRFSSLLNDIYEEIKYSDKSKSIEKEKKIYIKIKELNSLLSNSENHSKAEDIAKIGAEIILLIKERNLSLMQLNQGGL
jgi:hypothetical protein